MNTSFPQHGSISLEYKEAVDSLPKNCFETVCAFLNRDGGLIVFGVADNGTATGINPGAVGPIRTDIANLSNNPQKLDTGHLLIPHEETVGKLIIRIQVPYSPQVHRNGGLPHYAPGATPLFEELNDIFSATIPLTSKQISPEVVRLLLAMEGEMSRREIMRQLGLNDEKHFREHYQQQAIQAGGIELTIPEKPTSRLQKYKLTALGRAMVRTKRKP